MCCNTLQHAATHCNTFKFMCVYSMMRAWGTLAPHVSALGVCVCCNTLQHAATRCNTLQHAATRCNTLQHAATHCSTSKFMCVYAMMREWGTLAPHASAPGVCVCCNTLQQAATGCNTLQHTSLSQIAPHASASSVLSTLERDLWALNTD